MTYTTHMDYGTYDIYDNTTYMAYMFKRYDKFVSSALIFPALVH
jgi:hypothetical protein